ncbi:conserved hypothetical protein [uncultured Mycobacterium sp.]|uniref:Uncharacterized protein n=1 Tax=uncultured Mycobacterium sp. TaxID=171292 RepID=A0A1Y5NW48_9MYCO|nr:conserved hypothetical protein [uncultured Mycobacterium sp.]
MIDGGAEQPDQGRGASWLPGLAVGFSGAIGDGLKLLGPGRVILLVGDTVGLVVEAGSLLLAPHAVNTTMPTATNATEQTARIRFRPVIADPSTVDPPQRRYHLRKLPSHGSAQRALRSVLPERRGAPTGLSVW